MTGTNFQRKRSENGASLIMLVSTIGLAFIVTVAAFLVAASNGQETARIASAKVDIATREDALMRLILQMTATGMLPGTDGVTGPILTWTGLMTNAVTQLRATTYVDPTELTTLPGLTGVIPDNLGDTGGTPLGIFQGYNNTEAPFGGTSGLVNVVTPYNAVIQPPLMNWSGGTTLVPLSSATALTTPQEFFLGSQYSSTSSTTSAPITNLSPSNRWGNMAYPSIRFGYKQPGDITFIARRVWWRIPVVYQTTQQTIQDQAGVFRYPQIPANYVLSVYEIPSQLPISGNTNLQIGLNADGTAWGSGITVAGSVYGNQVQLTGGTYNGVSSRKQVNFLSSATVGGKAYSTNTFDQLITREQLSLTQTIIGAAPVSVAGNDGKVLLVPVMPGNQFYMSLPAATTPTHWDLYARPYYRCRVRIIITGTDSNLIYNSLTGVINTTTAGAINVTVRAWPDTTSPRALPDQILGFSDTASTPAINFSYSQAYNTDSSGTLPSYLTYWSTSTGTGPSPAGSDRNILELDIQKMATYFAGLGFPATQLYAVYIGSNPTTEPASPYTSSDPGVAILDAADLGNFAPSGLSIVTNQTLYLMDNFNKGATQPPTSLYAPGIRYGLSGAIANVALTGQISVDPAAGGTPGPTPTPGVNPVSLSTASGTTFTPNTAGFNEITVPSKIPPITRMSLMFTIEKERTN